MELRKSPTVIEKCSVRCTICLLSICNLTQQFYTNMQPCLWESYALTTNTQTVHWEHPGKRLSTENPHLDSSRCECGGDNEDGETSTFPHPRGAIYRCGRLHSPAFLYVIKLSISSSLIRPVFLTQPSSSTTAIIYRVP
jgi:hypothetical protein